MKTYARYKDSGISWIGEVPEHWDVVKGKRLYKRNDGGVWGDDPKNDGSDTIVLRSTEQEQDGTLNILNPAVRQLTPNERKTGMLYAGDIIITKSSGSPSHIGKASLITKSVADMCCCYSNFIQRIRIDGEPVFYWYLLNSKVTKTQFEILSTTTTGIKNLTSTIIGNIILSVPPLSEQKAIAEYLDKKTAQINGLVSAKQKQIELLKEYKQSVIASAVTGKLNKNSRMKDSGISWIGKIPENWDVKRVASFFDENRMLNKDFAFKKAYQFKFGTLVMKNEVGDEKEYEETYVKYTVLKKNDIVLNGLNLNYDFVSQRVAICPAPGIITSAYVAMSPRKTIEAMYYLWLFKTMDNKKMLHGMGSGIRLTLTFSDMKNQRIPVPPLSEQKEIVAYIEKKVSSINSQITSIENQIANLNEYKQSLISDVVTGKVKVC